MSTQVSTVEYLVDQMSLAPDIRTRAMFGEYAVYCQDKIVALICDDQLYVKPTEAGRAYLKQVVEGNPYPGAKPYFLITGDLCEDQEWLSQLIVKTAQELPAPKPKVSRKKAK
jgi:DNA transformation protein